MEENLEGDLKINLTDTPISANSPANRASGGAATNSKTFEQALQDLKNGDTTLARNLMRKLTISSRQSVQTTDWHLKARKPIFDYGKRNQKPPGSPAARDLYFVSYLHRFHHNRMEIKEESRMNRKKMILLEIKADLKRFFCLTHPIPKTHYKQQLERYSAMKKAKTELGKKYGNLGERRVTDRREDIL